MHIGEPAPRGVRNSQGCKGNAYADECQMMMGYRFHSDALPDRPPIFVEPLNYYAALPRHQRNEKLAKDVLMRWLALTPFLLLSTAVTYGRYMPASEGSLGLGVRDLADEPASRQIPPSRFENRMGDNGGDT